ncbi:hypothetical protein [Arthrobacter oryzae]|nr:hypothetical protein [Arthrobacter oryzae]
MSIEFAEIVSIVGATAPADLTSATRAITDAIARVEAEHPGYRHSNPNEIRCIARECSQYMDVPVGPGHLRAAAMAYAAHRAAHIDALLADEPPLL